MTGLFLAKLIGLVLLLGGSYLVLEACFRLDAPKPDKRARRAYR